MSAETKRGSTEILFSLKNMLTDGSSQSKKKCKYYLNNKTVAVKYRGHLVDNVPTFECNIYNAENTSTPVLVDVSMLQPDDNKYIDHTEGFLGINTNLFTPNMLKKVQNSQPLYILLPNKHLYNIWVIVKKYPLTVSSIKNKTSKFSMATHNYITDKLEPEQSLLSHFRSFPIVNNELELIGIVGKTASIGVTDSNHAMSIMLSGFPKCSIKQDVNKPATISIEPSLDNDRIRDIIKVTLNTETMMYNCECLIYRDIVGDKRDGISEKNKMLVIPAVEMGGCLYIFHQMLDGFYIYYLQQNRENIGEYNVCYKTRINNGRGYLEH